MEDRKQSLRAVVARRFLSSDLPLLVYGVMGFTIAVLIGLRSYAPDFTLNMISELLGAAFTLFIIDTLLVRSKSRRWKIVQGQVDYLIARTSNRLRDGIATRVFRFRPQIDPDVGEDENLASIRGQRAALFDELCALDPASLETRIDAGELFSERSYDYLNEKAEDVWSILNMKYSEYLAPELVSMLMDLHSALKDSAGHIRQYLKADRFTDEDDRSYYHQIGAQGITVSLSVVMRIINRLKKEGYSEAAPLTAPANA